MDGTLVQVFVRWGKPGSAWAGLMEAYAVGLSVGLQRGGYTIERCWLGKTSRFNDVADWSYADLPKVFRRDTHIGSAYDEAEPEAPHAAAPQWLVP